MGRKKMTNKMFKLGWLSHTNGHTYGAYQLLLAHISLNISGLTVEEGSFNVWNDSLYGALDFPLNIQPHLLYRPEKKGIQQIISFGYELATLLLLRQTSQAASKVNRNLLNLILADQKMEIIRDIRNIPGRPLDGLLGRYIL